MRINNIFTSFIDFPGRVSLVISVSGCNGNCKGCHSEPLKDWNTGEHWKRYKDAIAKKLSEGKELYSGIAIIGGDIYDNYLKYKKEVVAFFDFLLEFGLPILSYTRYQYQQLEQEFVVMNDFIKCGEYDENKTDSRYKLGSTNQYIVDKFGEKILEYKE